MVNYFSKEEIYKRAWDYAERVHGTDEGWAPDREYSRQAHRAGARDILAHLRPEMEKLKTILEFYASPSMNYDSQSCQAAKGLAIINSFFAFEVPVNDLARQVMADSKALEDYTEERVPTEKRGG